MKDLVGDTESLDRLLDFEYKGDGERFDFLALRDLQRNLLFICITKAQIRYDLYVRLFGWTHTASISPRRKVFLTRRLGIISLEFRLLHKFRQLSSVVLNLLVNRPARLQLTCSRFQFVLVLKNFHFNFLQTRSFLFVQVSWIIVKAAIGADFGQSRWIWS